MNFSPDDTKHNWRRQLLKAAVFAPAGGLLATPIQAYAGSQQNGDSEAYVLGSVQELAGVGRREGEVALTLGYRRPGDGGGACYVLTPASAVQNPHWDFASAMSGFVWRLAEARPNASMFGAAGDGKTDDTAALQAGLDYLAQVYEGGELFLSPLRYRSRALTLPKSTSLIGSIGGFSSQYPDLLAKSPYALLLDGGGHSHHVRGELCARGGHSSLQHGLSPG